MSIKKLLFFFGAVIILADCDSDDPKPVNKLIGNWRITEAKASLFIRGATISAYMVSLGHTLEEAAAFEHLITSGIEDGYLDQTLEFRGDGTWTGSGQTGTWKLSDDQTSLTLTNTNGTNTENVATILSLSDTDLQLEIPIADAPSGGRLVGETSSVLLKLKRE